MIDGEGEFELSPFSLDVISWIDKEFSTEDNKVFNGINEFNSIISDLDKFDQYADAVCKVIYYMIVDKDTIPSYCHFVKLINSVENTNALLAQFHVGLLKSISSADAHLHRDAEVNDLKKKIIELEAEKRILQIRLEK